MANLCDFTMQVKGSPEGIKKFYKAMIQDGDIWMGRGAEADITYDESNTCADIEGWCKWSVMSALIYDAKSMEKQRTTGIGNWHEDERSKKVKKYCTIYEACEMFNVNMEVFSTEPGSCFAEHYIYENGDIHEETARYEEYCIDEFKTKEDAEKELGIEITEREWAVENWISRGGFAEQDFNLSFPFEFTGEPTELDDVNINTDLVLV